MALHALDRRRFFAGGVALGIGSRGFALPASNRGATVDPTGGPGTVPTLAAALELADRAGGSSFTIRLGPGIITEKCVVRAPNVTIAGSGPQTVVSFGAAAGLVRPDGGKWGTGGSATLTVEASGVTLRNLTIRNSFDFLQDRITQASGGAQAVALSLGRGADRARVESCSIEGYQDTLYVQGRAHFSGCRISGCVDFIFGGPAALFNRCEIVSRFVPGAEIQGYLSAPSTPADQPFGLVFADCRITREAGVPDASTYLGRPWRAGGNMRLVGASAFLRCWMDAHIRGDGWTAMGFTDPTGQKRLFQPAEARLFEFGSRGPGAGSAAIGRRFLTASQAAAFTPRAVLGDWQG
ncbi:pectinesterase family protein [Sphingomonas mali]|uniref:pectinesterase family protein n=1 Tax=Sphingomonas mali TaxID=40682 RepID=UPI00082D109A|nr:pectinesterase family protein [Sphingomonas mali]